MSDDVINRPIERNFGFVIRDAARRLSRRFQAQAQQYAITLPQWEVITQLARTDSLSQTALAMMIDADQMTVGGLVARLEEKGLVARAADPRDNRAKIVSLTDRAKAIIDEMRPVADEIFVKAFEGVEAADRATMVSVLLRMSTNLSTTA